MASLTNRIILLTGATKGIGAATARAAVKAGAKVALNYSSDSSAAESLVSELGADNAFAIQADAGSVAGAEKMVQETVQKYGRIDVLILNAGILKMATLDSTTEADFDKHFNLNVKGPYFLAQKAVPHMKEGSRVILVTSSVIHSSMLQPPYLLYGATKGAVEAMTYNLARDLGAKGITVNAVGPGPTATDLFLNGQSDQSVKTIAGFSPFNKLGEPAELADVFVFLAGDASRWISGQIILVNGAAATLY